MLAHLLLITAVALGMALMRLLRRLEPGQRGYLLVVAGLLVATLIAMRREDVFLSAVVIGFTALTVVIPWGLEGMSRRSFARGQLSWAVRLAAARSILMPGAGLERQQQVLRGLGLLERQGVDAALSYFRELAGEAEDGGELAVIHEQIVSMLFYDQRWSEGIAHFEGQFPPAYAAMRPVLALGLLRAYGEAGRLDNAAGLLRALEDGPLGADPNAAELLGQARLTFLAYAGASRFVDEAVGGGHCKSLGLSQASGALFRGIALARAGERKQAVDELERVHTLAGPSDDRVVRASRAALDMVEQVIELEPELRRYVQAVGERLRSFLQTERLPRRRGPVFVTHFVVLALVVGYVATQLAGAGGLGLLRVGAFTPELWRAGSWGRLFTAGFVQTDLIGLIVDIYAVWLGGHVVERLLGNARMVLITLWGAIAGVLVTVAVGASPAQLIGGGSLIATGVLVAALWTLIPRRTPNLAKRARRSLLLTLWLLLGAQIIETIPGLRGIAVSPFALAAVAGVATILSGALPLSLPKPVRYVLGALAGLSVAAMVAGLWQVAREDVESFALAHREQAYAVQGVAFTTPWSFEETELEVLRGEALPVFEGLIDAQARRDGLRVQLVVAPMKTTASEEAAAEPIVFALDPALRRAVDVREGGALPSSFTTMMGEGGWRSYLVQRNGQAVARVVERPVGEQTAALVAVPPEALELAPVLYASMLRDAAVAEPEGAATAEAAEPVEPQ